jgi:hypothetical protein
MFDRTACPNAEPLVVRSHRNQHRSLGPDRPLAAATAALFPIEPEELLVVDQVTPA